MPGGNIKYKDSVFTLLFGEKDKCIELYNAISGTNYTGDVEFEMTTLEEALFNDRRNDISFVIDGHVRDINCKQVVNGKKEIDNGEKIS